MNPEIVHAIITAVGSVISGVITGTFIWVLGTRHSIRMADRQDRRAALSARYDRQKIAYEDFERITLDALHGGLTAADRERRRVDAMAFRARALFAFGDEKFANELMAAVFSHEDEHQRASANERGSSEIYEIGQRSERLMARMIGAIQQLERELRIPVASLTPHTDALIERVGHTATPRRLMFWQREKQLNREK